MAVQLAGCVLLDGQGRLLLIHRQTDTYDHWEIPGGKIEPNEGSGEAARRELHEELGVLVRLLRELGQATFMDRERQFCYHWWLAETDDEVQIREPQYFSEWRYISIAEMAGGNLSLSVGAVKLLQLVQNGSITL